MKGVRYMYLCSSGTRLALLAGLVNSGTGTGSATWPQHGAPLCPPRQPRARGRARRVCGHKLQVQQIVPGSGSLQLHSHHSVRGTTSTSKRTALKTSSPSFFPRGLRLVCERLRRASWLFWNPHIGTCPSPPRPSRQLRSISLQLPLWFPPCALPQ